MANYSSVEDIFATIENATVIRNNSKNDDGVDTIAGVDWFTYNGTVCSNIYASGNMFIGLGANSGHLKVNNRDGASYYIWREEGTLYNFYKFLRIRWQGYAVYNSSLTSYLQTFDVILWDTGDISLHMVNVPTSYYNGTFTLGSLSYTKPTTDAPDVTFKYQGNNTYVAEYSIIDIARKLYLSRGECEIEINGFENITQFLEGKIKADLDIPEGTEVKMFAKINDNEYVEYENNSDILFIDSGFDLSTSSLFVKFVLSTTDELLTPMIKGLDITIRDFSDQNIVLLTLASGNINSFQNAAGDVTVSYDGSGTLTGYGGPVAAFEVSFNPKDLIPKVPFNNIEHVTLSDVFINANLIRTIRADTKAKDEHVTLAGIEIVASLTHVDNI